MAKNESKVPIGTVLEGKFRLTKEIAYPMMRRKGGRIINITSVVGVTGNPGQANYCASKAGAAMLTRARAYPR